MFAGTTAQRFKIAMIASRLGIMKHLQALPHRCLSLGSPTVINIVASSGLRDQFTAEPRGLAATVGFSAAPLPAPT